MTRAGTSLKALTTKQKLELARDLYRDQILPTLGVKVSGTTTEKPAKAAATCHALQPGDIAPDFILPSVDGRSVRLYAELRRKPVVLVIYRGGWCPHCKILLRGFQESLAEFNAVGVQVIAISPQLPDQSLATREKGKLAFTVLSDVGLHAAHAFGVVYELPPALIATCRGWGVLLVDFNGTEGGNRLPWPAIFVIRSDSTIAYANVESDFTRCSEPLEVLRVVSDLKYVAA